MGATPLYLVIILARANAYLRESVTLHVSSTVYLQHGLIYNAKTW